MSNFEARVATPVARHASRRRTMTLLASAAVALAAAMASSGMTAAQEQWPTRNIRFVVGYPPGGGADVIARLFSERMSKILGQSIIVENRAGATGTIGALSVARAEPDGYTLYVAAISEISIAPATFKALPYDPVKDFKPIVQLAKWSQLLVASPSFPPNNLKELIAYAKANPGKANYSSFGTNSLNHVAGERFKLAAGIDAVHVPHKGSGPSLTVVMSSEIQFTFDSPATTLGLLQSGRLKAIAVAGRERIPTAPNIPTMAEAGLPGFTVNSWIGLLAPRTGPRSRSSTSSTRQRMRRSRSRTCVLCSTRATCSQAAARRTSSRRSSARRSQTTARSRRRSVSSRNDERSLAQAARGDLAGLAGQERRQP